VFLVAGDEFGDVLAYAGGVARISRDQHRFVESL